jgi:hypothetical protein
MGKARGERGLTERQQAALAAHEAARAAGKTLAAYAREQRLELRPLYDAIVGLRRRGVLSGAVPPSKRSTRVRPSVRRAQVRAAPFIAIDVARDAAAAGAWVVCRLRRADGAVIECGAWPDPAWLAAVLAARGDAAA